jgi:hypothetical protein
MIENLAHGRAEAASIIDGSGLPPLPTFEGSIC